MDLSPALCHPWLINLLSVHLGRNGPSNAVAVYSSSEIVGHGAALGAISDDLEVNEILKLPAGLEREHAIR